MGRQAGCATGHGGGHPLGTGDGRRRGWRRGYTIQLPWDRAVPSDLPQIEIKTSQRTDTSPISGIGGDTFWEAVPGETRLRHARDRQAELVAERAAHKRSIEGKLAERQQMLSSIKSEIAAIRAAEERRQAQLAAQARARLAAPQPLIPDLVTPEPSTTAPTVLPPAPAAKYGGVVGIAMQYLGIPYVYGGASPSGFDCSGFIMYVFGQVGVSLPHNAAAQYGYGTPVDRSQLQPGDLVFFNGLGHAGIYVGGGSFIHSPHTGDVVKISSLSGWYDSTWVGARRL